MYEKISVRGLVRSKCAVGPAYDVGSLEDVHGIIFV